MNEFIKRKLAQKNGTMNELRKAEIIKKVKTKYPHLDDEVAILRKMVMVLAEKIKEQHPDVDLTEFNEYNDFVELCKYQTDLVIKE